MPHLSVADSMYRILGPTGAVVWQGAALPGQVLLVSNKEATTVSITAGEAVRIDATTLMLGHFGMAASATPPIVYIGGLRVSATSNVNWLGVAAETIVPLADGGRPGRVFGPGSICCVQSVAAPTSNTIAANVLGSATAGKVDTAAAAAPGAGTLLGRVIQISGTTGPPTDTGTAGVLGIIVQIP